MHAGCIVAEASIQNPAIVEVLLDLQAHAASVHGGRGSGAGVAGGSAKSKKMQAAGGGDGGDEDEDEEVVILEERSAAEAAAGSQGGDEAGPARKRRRMQPRSLRQTQLPCGYCCYGDVLYALELLVEPSRDMI